MNKKDYAILSRLEGQIGGLEGQVRELKTLLVKHHNLGNRTLYVPFGILGISFLGSGLSLFLSKVSPSPIFAALPLMIAGLFALVYSFRELLRPERSISTPKD
ncbi:MAG: hypothetical protein WCD72_06485 [Dehalococcoidia bacterium]